MQRKLIYPDIEKIPQEFHSLFANSKVYDSSSSPEAQVMFIDKDKGYFLKSANKGALKKEADMTSFFHKKGLGAQVLCYLTQEKDWILTEKVQGEDCTFYKYLEEPKRLCDTTAELLRKLHSVDYIGCPVMNRTKDYFETAKHNYENEIYDSTLFPDNFGYTSVQEAWSVVEKYGHLLKNDTLLHGDYCLPNTILDNWQFSGFIDLGCGGVGDRHIDLFWGMWTLFYNLKTEKYSDRFLDAYGRSDVDREMLKVIAAFEVFG